jgi:hypothetical protein
MWRLDVTPYKKLPIFPEKRLHFWQEKVTGAHPVTKAG